jgi:hypothetical protein
VPVAVEAAGDIVARCAVLKTAYIISRFMSASRSRFPAWDSNLAMPQHQHVADYLDAHHVWHF